MEFKNRIRNTLMLSKLGDLAAKARFTRVAPPLSLSEFRPTGQGSQARGRSRS